MRNWKIAIVGGGPGGLMTAYELQRLADRPFRMTLFEASERLGGKILTPKFEQASVYYEAGAAEFYDYSQFDEDPLKELIAEMGLSISPMAGSAVIVNDQVIANVDDLRQQLGDRACDAYLKFDRLARDQMTPDEFHEADYPDGSTRQPYSKQFDSLLAEIEEPRARQFVEHLIHSDLATEPERTSVEYGLQNYLMNDEKYMGLYSIEQGNEQLPLALAARIDADVRLSCPVTCVEKADHGRWVVHSINQGVPQKDDFDFVVIALPHNQLNSVVYEGAKLEKAMRDHYDYYHYPAHYLRVTILFDRPFWRNTLKDSFWMLDRFGGCCLYDESSREPESQHGVLGWLLAGSTAEKMNGLSDAKLIEEALNSLPNFLAYGREFFIEGQVHRWMDAVNAVPGGIVPQRHDRRHQPEPDEHAELLVVGDYLFDSTLNGVLDSANYVAAWIAANLTDTPLA